MFCPQCQAEYRPGFTRCADCDVELVDSLSRGTRQADQPEGDLSRIWVGDDQSTCVSLCRQLQSEDIHYRVVQDIKSRGKKMSVNWRYELLVPTADEKRAKALLELPDVVVEESSELTEEDEEQALLELPETGVAAANVSKRDSYLAPWYPEDATVEVWSQLPSDDSDMVEMSLKENRIRVRVEVQDGCKKWFVLPEDEAQARDVVQDVLEGPAEAKWKQEVTDNSAETAENPDPNADAYCPLCLAGYRAGFTECSDCKMELVGTFEDVRTDRSRIWRGDQQSELDRILAVLDAENIVSHYKEVVNAAGRAQVLGIPIGPGKPTFEYAVWVLRKDLERAKEAIARTD